MHSSKDSFRRSAASKSSTTTRKMRMRMRKRMKIATCSRTSVSFSSSWRRRQPHVLEPSHSSTTKRNSFSSALDYRSQKHLPWKNLRTSLSLSKLNRLRRRGLGRLSRRYPHTPTLLGRQVQTHQECLLFPPFHTKIRASSSKKFTSKKVMIMSCPSLPREN